MQQVEVVEDVVEDGRGPDSARNCQLLDFRAEVGINHTPVKYEAPTPYANTGTSTPV